MKLRLPSILISAIIALQLTYTANADYIGNGVIYDNGKNHYASDPSVEGYVEDSMQCWAVAGSNAVQYWQDTYYDKRDAEFKAPETADVPNGVITNSPYAPPTGTRYLNVYETELSHLNGNNGGESQDFFDWWMKGINNTQNLTDKEAYYSAAFQGQEHAGVAYKGLEDTTDTMGPYIFTEGEEPPTYIPEGIEQMQVDLSNFIVETFKTQGQAATINLNYGHAISCWGYETDENGILTALILADGDDAQFGAFRATVSLEQSDILDMAAYFGEGYYANYGERLVLTTDDGRVLQLNATYGEDSPTIKPWVSGAARIGTPTEFAQEAEQAESTISNGSPLNVNTRLLESKEVSGDGIVIGNGQNAVILTSAQSTEEGNTITLSLDGTGSSNNHTGMTLQDGSMVSLYNLSVENYADGAIENNTKLYLHNGQQNISNNKNDGNGAGISNHNYTELQDNKSVVITNNHSTANESKGGGIYNGEKATVSIRGNEDVVFSGNSASRGNDIFNSSTGIVNIAANSSVTFIGDNTKGATDNVSIVNEGTLYLSSDREQHITFQNSSLETTGQTYIGKDKSDRSTNTDGAVHFTSKLGGDLSIHANNADGTYATLKNLTLNADTIAAAGAENGTLTNAVVTAVGPLTLSNVSLNSTDVITSASTNFITMDNVVVTLTAADYNFETRTFNLTNMLHGNFELTSVTFSLSGDEFTDIDLSAVSLDMQEAYANKDTMKVSLLKAGSNPILANVGQIQLASEPLPEPTTGTLGLLALAGLCGRRRRR